MSNLENQVGESAEELKATWTGLRGVSSLSLPQECYDNWVKRASLYRVLSETVPIFQARQKAWDVVQAAAAPLSITDSRGNLVMYGGTEMSFEVARHLTLTSYAAVTWSIYDRLANVCGRLAGTVELANNPRQNPKVCEDFLGKKPVLGFDTQGTIKGAYRWPLKVTYKIRNWLVHEGYEENSLPLFQGNRIADGFQLNRAAIDYLQRCCEYSISDGKIDGCCLTAAEECWPTGDALEILEKYHTEIDEMLESLVAWSVRSFIGQITSFSSRGSGTP